MNHSVKLNRVHANATWHKGPVTHAAVMAQVPQEVIDECPARIITAVADAINKAYHAGRASCGAEVIDGDAIWINALDGLYEFDDIRTLPRRWSQERDAAALAAEEAR